MHIWPDHRSLILLCATTCWIHAINLYECMPPSCHVLIAVCSSVSWNPKSTEHANPTKEELVPRMNLTHHAPRLADVMTLQLRKAVVSLLMSSRSIDCACSSSVYCPLPLLHAWSAAHVPGTHNASGIAEYVARSSHSAAPRLHRDNIQNRSSSAAKICKRRQIA